MGLPMSTADLRAEHGQQCYDEHLMLVCSDTVHHADSHEFCNHMTSTADHRRAVNGLEATPWFEPETSLSAEPDGYFIDKASVLALIDQHHCDEGVRVTPEALAEAQCDGTADGNPKVGGIPWKYRTPDEQRIRIADAAAIIARLRENE
jgi:hypothetical protein